MDLPRQAKNLKVHHLCRDPTSISQDLPDTLGLNLNFGISLEPDKEKIPIDFERLRRSIGLKFVEFPPKQEVFVPKLHSKSVWLPPNAPRKIEIAMNQFEESAKNRV
jgi:hypothetical protein